MHHRARKGKRQLRLADARRCPGKQERKDGWWVGVEVGDQRFVLFHEFVFA
jgi:hypothetical protein